MKKLMFLKRSLSVMLIAGAMVLVSCGDDDNKVSCSKSEEKFSGYVTDLLQAFSDEDCGDIEKTYNNVISLVKKAKSCDFVKEMMDEYSVDNVDDLADELAAERDATLEDYGC